VISFFFFFKQKTAYEIFTWLEFRRVLFRSSGRTAPNRSPRDTRCAAPSTSSTRSSPPDAWRRPRSSCRRTTPARPRSPRHSARRSEERRVGKERATRWHADEYRKKKSLERQ